MAIDLINNNVSPIDLTESINKVSPREHSYDVSSGKESFSSYLKKAEDSRVETSKKGNVALLKNQKAETSKKESKDKVIDFMAENILNEVMVDSLEIDPQVKIYFKKILNSDIKNEAIAIRENQDKK